MSADNGVMRINQRNSHITISLEVFKLLFENSHVYYLTVYQDALENKVISFKALQQLARSAQIPYSLFFAPKEMVKRQIEKSNEILFQGVSDGILSMSGRGSVEIRDIGLIIKDIKKRQDIMAKKYPEDKENKIISCLKNSHKEIDEQACELSKKIGFDVNEFRSCRSKEKAYEYLVTKLEDNNIFISRSRPGYMPQSINKKVHFSGIVVKSKKHPTIFLYSSDESTVVDMPGRRIFTTVLLLVCLAKGKFMPVSYDSQLKGTIEADEYKIAEEIVMPRRELEGSYINSFEEIEVISEAYKLTPSAVLMRMRRLENINEEDFTVYYDRLKERYNRKLKETRFVPKALETTKVISYCGEKFTRRMIVLLDAGKISYGDVRRILTFNKKSNSFIDDLRMRLDR